MEVGEAVYRFYSERRISRKVSLTSSSVRFNLLHLPSNKVSQKPISIRRFYLV